MKKLFLSTITFYLLVIGCNTNSETLVNEKKETLSTLQKGEKTEEIPFIRKVSATFNKVVQNENVWKKLKTVIEDNLVMKQNTTSKTDENNVFEDHVFLLTDFVTEDHVIVRASSIFEDNVMMKTSTIKDDLIMGKTTSSNIFIETYNALYPEETINDYQTILKKLPKLYFGVPTYALNNYDLWKEKGFPVTLKSYDANDNKLSKVSKEEVIENIGTENYEKLIENNEQEQLIYHLYIEKDVISVIAAKGKKGSVIIIKDTTINVASFTIDDENHYNNIRINENEETYVFPQNNAMIQTYIDLPYGCNDYYSFICGSPEMDAYTLKMQELANATCTTIWRCIPCCDPNYGSISYYTMVFEPTSHRCKKTLDYLQVLSMYPLTNT